MRRQHRQPPAEGSGPAWAVGRREARRKAQGGEAAGEEPAQAGGRRVARNWAQRIDRRARRFVRGEGVICKRD
jgi:hypothetical protein